GLNLDKKELSRYARRGSGSAARSIYGGFVEWQKGSDNSSYALPIDAASWDVGMVVVIVSGEKKQVSSRAGMKRTVETSPFYKGWLVSAELDLEKIKIAIKNRNLEEMGQIAERNGLKMHAAMLGANPPLLYWRPQSLLAIEQVKNMRREGIPCYFTMDAGPNVKIICRLSQAPLIKERLLEHFSENQIIITGPGPGAAVIAEESN
ncbi:MAG TPA: diphosphomevalonate decarboxylase, partial [Firmicutes bacterium]|nr:diphosphomevalonate decarboxylase [Bacillota bacterium]